jgi:hypothetical protein
MSAGHTAVSEALPVKNRKRENCTSGSVRDEDGNILIYSATHRMSMHVILFERDRLAL